jgi:cobalt-precorrin 5A hydrolase/precorrin-3B C17-methyltransferase
MRRYHTDKEIFVLHYASGEEVAGELCSALGAVDVPISEGGTKEAFSSRWDDAGAFVFIGALAIAVRSVATFIEDKAVDPAVVVVSEDGGVALPVIAGHIGLATDLARECADALSARGTLYVPTTSSDRAGFTAPDLWASRRGYYILLKSRLASVIAKFKAEGSISAWVDPIIPEHGIDFPLPFGYDVVTEQGAADVIISPRAIQKLVGAKPQIVPRVLTAGVGCRAGIDADTIERILKSALSRNCYGPFLAEAVAEIRTVEAKRAEPGMIRFAESHSLPLVIVPDSDILAMENNFTPSAASAHIGLPGAAEPSAASAGKLLGPRIAEAGVTVALAMSKPPESGELSVIGTGPGDARFVTQEARAAIDACEVLVGYKLYIDLIPEPWKRGKIVERYGMGEEEDRVLRAFSYVESGYRVALLSGGDASLFGMSSLCLSTLPPSVGPDRIRIIPGVTAAQAAGAAIGAPYSNGLVLISLSDYLQPWRDVVTAMEGARESGLAVAIYNPVQKGLSEKIDEVRRVFDGRRALLVRDAGRPDESLREKPVSEITADDLDMRTMMFILSPKARERLVGEKKIWIEARGYDSEAESPEKAKTLGQFLVLGGTTEGREAADCLTGKGYSVTVSVTREAGALAVPKGANVLMGARDAAGWTKLFGDADARAGLAGVVDATHPFAKEASREIASACAGAGIPLCRFVRAGETPEGAIVVQDLKHAVDRAIKQTSDSDVIFLAIGTNDLAGIMPRLRKSKRGVLVRMLPTSQSIKQAERAGLSPREIVAAWGAGGADFNAALCADRGVKCILSRESGPHGGVAEKAEAARKLGIPLVLISRPSEPKGVKKVADFEGLLAWCGELAKQLPAE